MAPHGTFPPVTQIMILHYVLIFIMIKNRFVCLVLFSVVWCCLVSFACLPSLHHFFFFLFLFFKTPGYPYGDGNCAPPACDVGSVPVGEYVFDHRAANVSVNNQTFIEWFVEDYFFGPTGAGNPLVSGFYIDDYWTESGPSEMDQNAVLDMGFSKQDVTNMINAYNENMNIVYNTFLQRGKFSWNQFYTDGVDCPQPFVRNTTCASALRTLCTATSPMQTRATMAGFSPGSCNSQMNPANLTQVNEDIANFLLYRGPYAYIGNGWLGCSRDYEYPAILNTDFGEPIDALCHETAPNSQIFVREYTKATIQMDCNTYTPTFTMKE
jgi:hypothetical protein